MTDAERLEFVLPRVMSAITGVARDLEVTNDELLATLGFLGDVARADELVLLADVLGLSRVVDDLAHAGTEGTPSNVLGPFYVPGAPWLTNPGSIVRNVDQGSAVTVRGVVRDAHSGLALPAAVVDIWQANAAGEYSNESGALDRWNLRGRQRTDAAGRYAIETVVPSHYTVKNDGPVGQMLAAAGRHPWRPAHIHFLIEAEGFRGLVTQLYIAGGSYLDDDTINGVKDALVVPVVDGLLEFDIALARDIRS
jgi:protocatechuate 3,4-dioxygenase beta subunit